MAARKANLSETELEVLKVLWSRGPSTAREVGEVLQQQGRRWAYTTVLTLLHRLLAKGYAESDKGGSAHVFRSAVSRDKLLVQKLKHLAAELCEGTATPLVQALVQTRRWSAEEIEHLRRLLDELEAKPPPRKRT